MVCITGRIIVKAGQ